jgi:hypothetical protein
MPKARQLHPLIQTRSAIGEYEVRAQNSMGTVAKVPTVFRLLVVVLYLWSLIVTVAAWQREGIDSGAVSRALVQAIQSGFTSWSGHCTAASFGADYPVRIYKLERALHRCGSAATVLRHRSSAGAADVGQHHCVHGFDRRGDQETSHCKPGRLGVCRCPKGFQRCRGLSTWGIHNRTRVLMHDFGHPYQPDHHQASESLSDAHLDEASLFAGDIRIVIHDRCYIRFLRQCK